nr:hypothetical protein [Tanacetum cinerariifolium]
MMNLHMMCLDSQTARRNQKRLCLELMREVKVKARLDQTLVLNLKPRRDQTLVIKMKARLDQTLMKFLKARLDQTLVILERMFEDILGGTTNTGDSNGVEADLGNMENNILVSPIPTFRIHKDHLKSQIIGLVDTPVQTRHKSKEMEEQSFIA